MNAFIFYLWVLRQNRIGWKWICQVCQKRTFIIPIALFSKLNNKQQWITRVPVVILYALHSFCERQWRWLLWYLLRMSPLNIGVHTRKLRAVYLFVEQWLVFCSSEVTQLNQYRKQLSHKCLSSVSHSLKIELFLKAKPKDGKIWNSDDFSAPLPSIRHSEAKENLLNVMRTPRSASLQLWP